jgi:uncharacterized protein YjbI with pentapeptide repeats
MVLSGANSLPQHRRPVSRSVVPFAHAHHIAASLAAARHTFRGQWLRLHYAKFYDAKFYDAKFYDAKFYDAKFYDAKFYDAKFHGPSRGTGSAPARRSHEEMPPCAGPACLHQRRQFSSP